ncbi:MAG TPA: FAD-binding protein [Nitriliruptorales bacterium]|nr:FAD-binding protein [Nitriliruptorales bacterium]
MRNYGQFCPIARGSAILAERWTPIILRNILLGCHTFNGIAAGAPGLSRALLTRRLRELARDGIIEIRPKPGGRGALYEPTVAGRELWPVLNAIGDWAEQWMYVNDEHADPDVVLWSWFGSFLIHDRLPDHRATVRFDLTHRGRRWTVWILVEHGDVEICNFDPGFGDDVTVTVQDALSFARWHLGLLDWAVALRSGGVAARGDATLRRALPTWNAGPEVHRRLRAEHDRVAATTAAVRPAAARSGPQRPSGTPRRTTTIPGFGGRVITPEDPDYDNARAVWNGAIDRRPRAIARCASVDDVVAALRAGRERALPITVRGGGHGVAGTAVSDGCLVIDLGPLKAIAVDPARRTATVQAGVVWGELDACTQAFGLATTGGLVSHTGVAGLTLGGGMGHLMRRHGLTVDNLLAADVVTVDGQRITASERGDADLFWGLRGGGPGLGVVTSFTFRLHPVGPDVLAGPILWALDDAPSVLRAYREFVASAPPEVATAVVLRRAPAAPFLPVELHRRPICVVSLLALAEPVEAERMLAPMRGIGRPLLDLVKHRPYTQLQSFLDTTVPHGWHYYWKSAGLRDLDDTVIDTMVEHAGGAHSPLSYTVMFHLGGAVAEVAPDATAYSRRSVPHELNVNSVWLPGQYQIAEAETAWARAFIGALAPYHAGVYLNFLDRDDLERRPAAFAADTYRRLSDLRRRYDPDEVLLPHDPTAGMVPPTTGRRPIARFTS